MKVIFGLGNPGREYDFTRHNLGFLVLDRLAASYSAEFLPKSKFFAHVAEFSASGEKILLVKPQTYYNEGGQAARAIIDFYKLQPTNLLAVHDELALPFGTLRVRSDGSDAGNNGIKSLSTHLGPQYPRLRIGIATQLRNQMNDADFVLGRFNAEEQAGLTAITDHAQTIVKGFINGTLIPSNYTAI